VEASVGLVPLSASGLEAAVTAFFRNFHCGSDVRDIDGEHGGGQLTGFPNSRKHSLEGEPETLRAPVVERSESGAFIGLLLDALSSIFARPEGGAAAFALAVVFNAMSIGNCFLHQFSEPVSSPFGQKGVGVDALTVGKVVLVPVTVTTDSFGEGANIAGASVIGVGARLSLGLQGEASILFSCSLSASHVKSTISAWAGRWRESRRQRDQSLSFNICTWWDWDLTVFNDFL